MLNFLQQKNKNQIIFEYLLRAIVFLLLFVFLSSLILISLFVPSFFFVKYKNDSVNSQFLSAQQKNINKGEDPILYIKNINRLAIALADNTSTSANYTDIVNKIVSLKNNNIKIISISVTNDVNSNSKRITINGVANTRDSLTLYDKNLRIDGFFDSVTFPVSNFIQSTDSNFTATLIYKNK